MTKLNKSTPIYSKVKLLDMRGIFMGFRRGCERSAKIIVAEQ